MRTRAEYERVAELLSSGMNDCQVARATGINRVTVREWRVKGAPGKYRTGTRLPCPICEGGTVDPAAYAYLLGLYLGDGHIVRIGRVWCLRIFQDRRYGRLIAECVSLMRTVSGRNAGYVLHGKGCIAAIAYWKHWTCVFPQHGPGRKHDRLIQLAPWQAEIARAHPDQLLRGLINSDGSRTRNRVNGTIYPRYEFSNRSDDIRGIFTDACRAYGIRFTCPRRFVISVAKANDVAKLDTVIGPKS